MEEKKKSSLGIVIVVFLGCVLIGAGLGNAFDAQDVGGSIGIGVGFISMGAIWVYFRNK